MFRPKKVITAEEKKPESAEQYFKDDGVVVEDSEDEIQTLKKKIASLESKERKNIIKIVPQLPVQEIKFQKTENGDTIEYVTVEEALSELLTAYRNEKQ